MILADSTYQDVVSICEKHKVKRLYIYGSVANGTENSESDLDFLVEFNRNGYEGAFNQFMDFKESLEKVCNTPVDLIQNGNLRNSVFAEELERTKKLIYAA